MANGYNKFFKHLAAGLLAAVSGGALLGSSAKAITENAFRYAEPRTAYLMIGPADFSPEDPAVRYSTNRNSSIEAESDDVVCFYAPVRLPQSAVFKQLKVFYARPTAADSIQVSLRRVASGPSNSNTLANYPPEQAPVRENGVATYPARFPDFNVISNHQHRYDVELCLAKAASFFNARVDYTYVDAGD